MTIVNETTFILDQQVRCEDLADLILVTRYEPDPAARYGTGGWGMWEVGNLPRIDGESYLSEYQIPPAGVPPLPMRRAELIAKLKALPARAFIHFREFTALPNSSRWLCIEYTLIRSGNGYSVMSMSGSRFDKQGREVVLRTIDSPLLEASLSVMYRLSQRRIDELLSHSEFEMQRDNEPRIVCKRHRRGGAGGAYVWYVEQVPA